MSAPTYDRDVRGRPIRRGKKLPIEPRSDLARRIRETRERQGISQSMLAQLLGFKCKSQVAQWDRGDCAPSADNIAKLCLVLDVSADWLLGLSDTIKREE